MSKYMREDQQLAEEINRRERELEELKARRAARSPVRADAPLRFSLYYQYTQYKLGVFLRVKYTFPGWSSSADAVGRKRQWNRIAKKVTGLLPTAAAEVLQGAGLYKRGEIGALVQALSKKGVLDASFWRGLQPRREELPWGEEGLFSSADDALVDLVEINALVAALLLEIDLHHALGGADSCEIPEGLGFADMQARNLFTLAIERVLEIDAYIRGHEDTEVQYKWPMMLFDFPIVLSWLILEPEHFYSQGQKHVRRDESARSWLSPTHREKLRRVMRGRLESWLGWEHEYIASIHSTAFSLLHDPKSLFHIPPARTSRQLPREAPRAARAPVELARVMLRLPPAVLSREGVANAGYRGRGGNEFKPFDGEDKNVINAGFLKQGDEEDKKEEKFLRRLEGGFSEPLYKHDSREGRVQLSVWASTYKVPGRQDPLVALKLRCRIGPEEAFAGLSDEENDALDEALDRFGASVCVSSESAQRLRVHIGQDPPDGSNSSLGRVSMDVSEEIILDVVASQGVACYVRGDIVVGLDVTFLMVHTNLDVSIDFGAALVCEEFLDLRHSSE